SAPLGTPNVRARAFHRNVLQKGRPSTFDVSGGAPETATGAVALPKARFWGEEYVASFGSSPSPHKPRRQSLPFIQRRQHPAQHPFPVLHHRRELHHRDL